MGDNSTGIASSKAIPFVFLLMFAVSKAVGLNSADTLYRGITYLALALCVVHVCRMQYTVRQIVMLCLLLGFAVATTVVSHSLGMLMFAIALVMLQGIPEREILALMRVVWCASFWLVVALGSLGVLTDGEITQTRRWRTETRYSLGFSHPNMLHACLFIWVALTAYHRRRMMLRHLVLGMALNAGIYCFSRSVTGFGLCTITLVGFWIISYLEAQCYCCKTLTLIGGWACAVPAVGSLIAAYCYDPNRTFWFRFNQFLTGRIEITHAYFERYGIALLGHDLRGGSLGICDNAYGYTLIQYGVVAFGLLAVGYAVVLYRAVKRNDLRKVWLCLLFLVYGITEQFVQNCFMNCTLLLFADIVWNSPESSGERLAGVKEEFLPEEAGKEWRIYERAKD